MERQGKRNAGLAVHSTQLQRGMQGMAVQRCCGALGAVIEQLQ